MGIKQQTNNNMIATNHPRIMGILAARDYLLSRNPSEDTVKELQELGTKRARKVCLLGMPLQPRLSAPLNVLGNPLPSISL
jgi:hypothetical protein